MKTIRIQNNSKKLNSNFFANIIEQFSMWVLILPCLLSLIIVMWKPMAEGVVFSFFKLENYSPVAFVGLENYKKVLLDPLFFTTLKNTFYYVLWSIILGFLPPILLSVMLNEMVHMKGIFRFLLYFPVIAPSVAASLIWYFMFQPGDGGVLNMFLSKINVHSLTWLQDARLTIPLIVFTITWKSLGSNIVIYLACLQSVNQDLYEASMIDGANILRRFFCVTLPHMSTLILLTLVRQIIGIFQIMQQPLILTDGGPNSASLSLCLQSYLLAFKNFRPAEALALGVVTFLILIVITVFYFRLQRKMEVY